MPRIPRPPLTIAAAVLAACVAAAVAGTASAGTNARGVCTTAQQRGMTGVFPTHAAQSNPAALVTGPDGNMWFTDAGSNAIGRMTPAGAITEFPLPAPNEMPYDIVAGPDGNMWFTEGNVARIGRITMAGAVTEFPIPWATPISAGTQTETPVGQGITVGPDGNLWFAESDSAVGRLTTDGTFTRFPITVTPTPSPGPTVNPALAVGIDIVSGPGGMLWVSLANAHSYALASVTTSGVSTSIGTPTGDTPGQMTTDAAGRLWYLNSSQDVITRMTPATAPGGQPAFVRFPRPVTSSLGAGWSAWGGGLLFAGQGGQLGSVNMAGVITEYPVAARKAFVFGTAPNPIAAFPSGRVAMGEDGCGAIGLASARPSVGMWATQRPPVVRRGRAFTMKIRSSARGTAAVAIATANHKTTLVRVPVKAGINTVRVSVPKRLNRSLVGSGSTLVLTGAIAGMPQSGQSAPVTVK